MPNAVREGYQTVTPALTVRNGAEAIEFYKKAFGAEEIMRVPGPDGKSIMHAEIRVGTSRIMLGDEAPSMGCLAPVTLGGPATHVEDLAPEEMARRQREFFASMAKK